MDGVRSYLLSVTGAAILCCIASRFLGKKGAGSVARLLTGLFLTFTVLRPLADRNIDFLSDFSLDYGDDAAQAVAQGEEISKKALAQLIKEETGAYILKKANQLHADIQVSVEVSDDPVPKPVRLQISGSIAPNAKIQLQTMIEQQLGISKENQKWT